MSGEKPSMKRTSWAINFAWRVPPLSRIARRMTLLFERFERCVETFGAGGRGGANSGVEDLVFVEPARFERGDALVGDARRIAFHPHDEGVERLTDDAT